MKKEKTPIIPISDGLQHQVRLFIKAMEMVSAIYGSSLSHEEFMDKAEEFLCILQEDESAFDAVADAQPIA